MADADLDFSGGYVGGQLSECSHAERAEEAEIAEAGGRSHLESPESIRATAARLLP
jgi:hypothetical protein